jgi:polar amino acid transport system substrate-binding protein
MKMVQIGRSALGKAWLGLGAAAQIAVAAASISTIVAPVPATAKTSEACTALQAKYPSLNSKTLVNAVNPHTPGYEALDPDDPSKYVGFDIDLGEAIGECLGFKVT